MSLKRQGQNEYFNYGSPFGQDLGLFMEKDYSKHQSSIETARNLVNIGLSIDEIAFQTGISIAELKSTFYNL